MINNIDFDLHKEEFSSEEELKEYVLSMALYYGSKMNEIENHVSILDERHKGEQGFNIFEEFKKLYLPVFEAFASDKKRIYGGEANSFGTPTKYDFDAEYLFIIIRKNNLWRIDNVKDRWYSNEKWRSMIM